MKKVVIGVLVLMGVGGLIALLGYHPKSNAVGANTPAPNTGSADPTVTPAAASSAAASAYKDGTYTGSAVENAYGQVQVQAVVSGGKITAINFLQMPSDQQHSQMVTSEAEPILQQEAISAQSANVDTVSGATQDSEAFTESLQAALSQAKG